MTDAVHRIPCRSCEARDLRLILDLGSLPLADALVHPDRAAEPEVRYPLRLAFCPDCSLVQILESAPAVDLFGRDFPYYSSYSDTLLEHSAEHARRLIARRDLGPRSFVLEIGSNDGYMLKNFVEAGIPVLGVDPAGGPARAAIAAGVPTRTDFFTRDLAEQLAGNGIGADLIIANNVLAHVGNPNDLISGVARMLKPNGTAVFEFPYVRDLIDRVEFDTIYHEHHCYFSVKSVTALLARHGLRLVDVELLAIHGGSLRVTVARGDGRSANDSVRNALDREDSIGLGLFEYYADFVGRVDEVRTGLKQRLLDLKSRDLSIAAYGAAAKGAMLLNVVGIGRDILDFVVDRNVHKQGLLMPGVQVPIGPPSLLLETPPDYVLVLAWNLAEEIAGQQQAYLDAGGQFICAMLEP